MRVGGGRKSDGGMRLEVGDGPRNQSLRPQASNLFSLQPPTSNASHLNLLRKLLLVAFCCGMPLSGAWAAEWTALPSIGVTGLYNDNLFLTPLPHHETYGLLVTPAVEFSGKTERLNVSSQVKGIFASYYGERQFNFFNLHLPFSIRYQTEKDMLGFTGGFVRDHTLAGELLDTGLVLGFTQRNQWTANPTWVRKITENLSFQSGLQLSDTTYEDGLRLGLRNFQLFGGSGGLLYHLTEQDEIRLSGSYSDYHTTNAPLSFRASFPGVDLSLTHAFTETLTGTVFGGPSFVSSSIQTVGGSIKSERLIWRFGGSLAKKFEYTSIQVNVARSIQPSGFGGLVQTDRAGVTISHNLSDALSASLNGSVFKTSSLTPSQLGATFPESRFASVTPAIAWKFAEWWKLELSYSYRIRDVDGFSEPVMSNGTMFTLSYNYW
ncbi:MAG: hypothetical protein CAF45_013185 [Nitrospira sp. CG24E]|nr:MAG: hypothetical protein CAF45_013185 [Nitrospira sp. CG24E]